VPACPRHLAAHIRVAHVSASRSRRLTLPSPVSLTALWEQRVGSETPREAWIEQQSKARLLREQSDDLARRLEAHGIPAFDDSRQLSIVGLVTEQAEQVRPYRNINFLPAVQSKNKREMLKSVSYWMDTTPASQRRMWVLSWGWVSALDLREAAKELARAVSRLSADDEMRKAKLELVLRSTEFTAQRDDQGNLHWNLHAHILLRARKFLGSGRWNELRDRMAERYSPKRYINDSPIGDAAEVVKYSFKPAELMALDDAELVGLFSQTRGLHLHQPLGELRDLRQQLDAQSLRLVRLVPTGKGERGQWATLERPAAPKREKSKEASPAAADVILSITLPQPKFSPRAEPCLVVTGYSGDFATLLRKNPSLGPIAARARAFFYGAHYDDNCPGASPPPLPYSAVALAIRPPPKPPPELRPPPPPFFVP
jgi:hypothetical protein